MIEAQLAKIMRALINGEAQSLAKIAKKLSLSQSELRRLLVVLGENEHLGGLGLIKIDDTTAQTRLKLTERGKIWISANQ
jgi:DNA-binding IclR family transcriptional regulator